MMQPFTTVQAAKANGRHWRAIDQFPAAANAQELKTSHQDPHLIDIASLQNSHTFSSFLYRVFVRNSSSCSTCSRVGEMRGQERMRQGRTEIICNGPAQMKRLIQPQPRWQ